MRSARMNPLRLTAATLSLALSLAIAPFQAMAWGSTTAPNNHIAHTSLGAWMADVNNSLNPWRTANTGRVQADIGLAPSEHFYRLGYVGSSYDGPSSPYGSGTKTDYSNWSARWNGHVTGYDKEESARWLGYMQITVSGMNRVEAYFYATLRTDTWAFNDIADLPGPNNPLIGSLSGEEGFIGGFEASDHHTGVIMGQFWDRNNDPNSKPEGAQGVYFNERNTLALGDDNIATWSTPRRR